MAFVPQLLSTPNVLAPAPRLRGNGQSSQESVAHNAVRAFSFDCRDILMPIHHIKPPPAVPAYALGLAEIPRGSFTVIAIEAPPGPQGLAAILAIVVRRFTPLTISSVQRRDTQHMVVTIDGSRLDRSLSLLRSW